MDRVSRRSSDEAVQAWVDALRRQADKATLKKLPPLLGEDAARVMALMRSNADLIPAASRAAPVEADVQGVFRPRLTLQTLTRGHGLLGMKPSGPFGPRGGAVTVARIDWTYTAEGGHRWETPAPHTVLNTRPPPVQTLVQPDGGTVLMARDVEAEADALDLVLELDLHPLPADCLQWRTHDAVAEHDRLWSLVQEEFFGDFWADQVPRLQVGS